MKRLAFLLLLLWPTPAPAQCWGQGSPSVEGDAHQAAVRVTVDDGGMNSLGSGVLVADQDDRFGYVLTNEHVVRDRGSDTSVIVSFPGGHQSRARVLKTDGVWDLAVLKIQEPPVEPVELAVADPRQGDRLTAAGYGPEGYYRAVSGTLVGYRTTAGAKSRNTLVIDVAVRGGDSGGPILNESGELAGVLWGTAQGDTYGTCCGRIRRFLAGVFGPPRRRPGPMPGPIDDDPVIADDPPAPDDDGESIPDEPFDDGDDDLAARLGTIETQLAELLASEPVAGPQGEPGEAGPPGPIGSQGPTGEAAAIDAAALQAMLDGYLRTRPIRFELYAPDGRMIDFEEIPLGGTFRLRLNELAPTE